MIKDEKDGWAKFEDDLHSLKDKLQDDKFAQSVYAALCNMKWKSEKIIFHCSWRFAGELIAEIRDKNENYLDFYCSGMCKENISEGEVTDKVELEFKKLGWTKLPWDEDE